MITRNIGEPTRKNLTLYRFDSWPVNEDGSSDSCHYVLAYTLLQAASSLAVEANKRVHTLREWLQIYLTERRPVTLGWSRPELYGLAKSRPQVVAWHVAKEPRPARPADDFEI